MTQFASPLEDSRKSAAPGTHAYVGASAWHPSDGGVVRSPGCDRVRQVKGELNVDRADVFCKVGPYNSFETGETC